MFDKQCMLALFVLCVRSGHSFSWDIVVARANRLEFYNEGALIYSTIVTHVSIKWITYDPVHNRVLFTEKYKRNDSATSFDIETQKIQSLIKQEKHRYISTLAYDPVTGLLYGTVTKSIYSFLIKPGSSNIVKGDLVINLKKESSPRAVAVDSCGGYIYWSTFNKSNVIERVRYDGTEREVIIDSSNMRRDRLTIDEKSQKIYWIETEENVYDQFFIESADLNGKNRRTIYSERESDILAESLTVSEDFISWGDTMETFFWQIPKNPAHGANQKPKKISMTRSFPYGSGMWTHGSADIAANYNNIDENCKARKSMLPNPDGALNASTYESLFCLHGTKVSGQSLCKCTLGYTGDRCDISVCQNYCFQGNCSVSTEGQSTCRCNAGYSGKRCEVNACHEYCLNKGVCSLNEENNPTCQCTGSYQGERCGVPVFCIKCYQTISLLKNNLDADLTPLTLGKGWEPTCASTEVEKLCLFDMSTICEAVVLTARLAQWLSERLLRRVSWVRFPHRTNICMAYR